MVMLMIIVITDLIGTACIKRKNQKQEERAYVFQMLLVSLR